MAHIFLDQLIKELEASEVLENFGSLKQFGGIGSNYSPTATLMEPSLMPAMVSSARVLTSAGRS